MTRPSLAKFNEDKNELEKVRKVVQSFNRLFIHLPIPLPAQSQNFNLYISSLEKLEDDPKIKEAIYTLPYKELAKFFSEYNEINETTILEFINTNYFHQNILELFDAIDLGKKFNDRKEIINEALNLYKYKYFSGCLCLLYTQLEGIITDYLIQTKKLFRTENKHGKPVLKHGTKEIKGFYDKLNLSKDINDNFLRLKEYKLDTTENINFSDERNNVLHGTNIFNFDKKNCFTIFIWINSILMSISKIQTKS